MNLARYWKPASAVLLAVVLGVGAWLWFRTPASSGNNNPPSLDPTKQPPLPKDLKIPERPPFVPKDAPPLPKDLPLPPKDIPAPPRDDSGVPPPPPPPLAPPKDLKPPM